MVLDLYGVIQGVGFRPHLHQLASAEGLRGTIRNLGDRVEAVLEGNPAALDRFIAALADRLPPHAAIEKMFQKREKSQGLEDLRIIASETGARQDIVIPADIATCDLCTAEFRDPRDRRYLYPFIACAHCGPRYTVVESMPYDRERTSLKDFPLCEACQGEYESPANRRFHAETTACPSCGPSLRLRSEDWLELPCRSARALERELRRILLEGKILAVRGIGGYQLAADASNAQALAALRHRKRRPRQPFAVMARELATVRAVCRVSPEEEALLRSPSAPIVILDVHSPDRLPLAQISPDTATLGVMLPTTPIHHLLFGVALEPAFDFLLMTSGNAHGEPLCHTNEEASVRLRGIADYFLSHDREVRRRCDDSIVWHSEDGIQVLRGARGVTPKRLVRKRSVRVPLLALGAELKNTLALAYDNRIVLSPHIGNLSHHEAFLGHRQMTQDFPEFYSVHPKAIAVDLHPEYASTILGRKLAREQGLELLEIQHHHAHAAACMAEHGLSEALALVFDGTGYGTDGTLWGGELLQVDPSGFKRLARFAPSALPGGEKAIQQPWRQACARLLEIPEFSGTPAPDLLAAFGIDSARFSAIATLCQKRLNAPMSSSVGRYFDATAAILGLAPGNVSYEGEAAIRLESLARTAREQLRDPYPFSIEQNGGLTEIRHERTTALLLEETLLGREKAEIAWRFHVTIAAMAQQLIEFGRQATGLETVVLSGGVFQNRLLTRLLREKLRGHSQRHSLTLHEHREIPPNDGGISFGQAVVAVERLRGASRNLQDA